MLFHRFMRRDVFALAFVAAALSLTACAQNGASPNAGAPVSQQAAAMRPAAAGHVNHAVSAVVSHPRGFVAVRPDSANSIYDSIVVNRAGKTPSDISSLGFECCSTKEFGDGLVFTHAGARLRKISVVLDSWACESGFWYSDDCSTTPGSGFTLPITVNVYAVNAPPSGPVQPGALLATQTRDFFVPYRPSKNDTLCVGPDLGKFIGPVDKECDNGLAVKISYDLRLPKVILPAQAIVTVAYNTSDAGYNPIGQNTPCFTGPGGCGYDALNVSADGNGGFIGSNVDPNGVFVNFGNPYFYCSGSGSGLILDTPCWTGYHPEINVLAGQ